MRVSKTFHFDFDHPADKLWAVVSDTPRWGEASGFPKYQAREQLQSDGTVKIFGSVQLAGLNLSWEEPPVNWVAEHWFEQERIFDKGPIAKMTTVARLENRGERSGLEVELTFETKNVVGTLLAKRMVGVYKGKVRELLDNADHLIQAEEPVLFTTPYQPPASKVQRAQKIADAIAATPYNHGLVGRLVELINQAQEVDLWSMRPIAIARRWQVTALEVVELFLQSVRSGLLESRWDILCPRCRVSMTPIANMSDLPHGVHCEACNIDFESDFASNVELSFSPSPAIRAIENGFFCRSGPGVTPHIKGQCSLPPGTSRSLPLKLKPGDYRVRTLEAGEEIKLTWSDGRFPAIHVAGHKVELAGDSQSGEINMANCGDVPRTVVIEEQGWLHDVLTAERVTTMQAFRDLFSDQVLRPGDEVRIRNISFMFTDLAGSTSLFSTVGDADAYHLVREHFAALSEIIRRHRGNVVKTVGDGIHAAFLMPDDALLAAIEIQLSVPEFNRRLGLTNAAVRIGLHTGSSISVTLNDRLDYYGEAVNLAARLEGQGEAGDITLSRTFAEDPAVATILRDYALRHCVVDLKGFDQSVAIVQITPSYADAE